MSHYDEHRFFRYAILTITEHEFDMRRRTFRELNEQIAGLGCKYAQHSQTVGSEQAVADYLCGLVERGVIPWREKYQSRH